MTAYAPFDTLWTQHAEASTGVRSASLALSLVDHKAHQHGYISTGSMDAFASIALATQSNPPTLKRTVNGHYNAERPSKRARSEKLPSPDWSRKRAVVVTRPATSYEQSLESKLLEAELLLNFSQCARRASASSAISQASKEHARDTMGHLSNGPQESPSQVPFTELEDVAKDETIGDWRAELQTASQMHGDIDEMTVTVGPERGIKSFSRLPMAAGSEQHEDVYMTRVEASADAKIADTVQAMDGGRERPNGMDRSEEGPESPSPATKIPRAEKDSSLPQTNEEVSFQLTHTATDIVEPENARQDNEPREAAETPRHDEEDVLNNESRVIHGALGENGSNTNELSVTDAIHAEDNIPNIDESLTTKETTKADGERSHLAMATATCAACNFSRNSLSMDSERNATSWISCDGCKSWYHFACAGFKNEREVRSVDKYRCRKCKPVHGSTTYVRKSSRAHSAIDYAGLHQGVIKTSDERPEHHYIQPIKDGIITFLPETFARMRPELVTAEYFEKGVGMKEPIVIPASFNPRPWTGQQPSNAAVPDVGEPHAHNTLDESSAPNDWFPSDPDLLTVLDEGQDALDMVMPRGLTVRRVAELYGPEEKVEVIDVKSQNGEQKKWNLRRWVDYYEDQHEKVVRNVISLEVSHSKLGRLIRRPKIVRELDLQDSVWPEELLTKGEYPRVQFYCLMSVADCFTDFHIDFGGSSVFYHILKGKKTFLFIPPKEKNLKKYEEWCMSPAQNWTFLADQTKECYRVDLSEGDTMLIPAGWIHAVWTPEDSLVIGGNFLTRMNFAMQLRVAQIEKATGVGRKFRYPHFQKLHWYTALRYLEDDPLPASVRDLLEGGGTFDRDRPTHYDFDAWGENSRTGSENYHTRYYSQSELDGLPDLVRYLLRTALIDTGSITDGITAETRNAVKKSIPRGHRHGEPLEVVKRFAVWCAWKRGNEPIPHWAYPDAVPESVAPDKLSAAATKRLDREAALSAPRRQSARMRAQQQVSISSASAAEGSLAATGDLVEGLTPLGVRQMSSQADVTPMNEMRRPRIAPGTSMGSHRKTACESCRKRRRACKHKDQVEALMSSVQGSAPTPISTDMEAFQAKLNALGGLFDLHRSNTNDQLPLSNDGIKVVVPPPSPTQMVQNGIQQQVSDNVVPATPEKDAVTVPRPVAGMGTLAAGSGSPVQSRPRTKACSDCRKSKVSHIYPVVQTYTRDPNNFGSDDVYMTTTVMKIL